jgi:lysophospholipase L1-like esterase
MPAARPSAAALAALLAVAAGCAAPPLAPAGAAARAVFFGSSTTAGAGASRPERRWTTLLSRSLGWTEVNRGLSGSTLTDLGPGIDSGEERWRAAVAGEPPDVVVVMYGANDVLARVPLGDPATPGTFHHAAAEVLRGLRETLPRARLVVLSPQPNRALAAARDPYDRALAEEAAAAGAVFVAAGTAFPADRADLLAPDGLHLADAGHAELAAFLARRVDLALGPAGTRAAGGGPAAAPGAP